MSVRINPGYDHHNHPCLYSLLGNGIDISAANTTQEALKLTEKSIGAWTGEIVLVTGWNNSKYDLTQKDLDRLPRPVIVFNVSFHGAIVNKLGMMFLAFPKDTPGIMDEGKIVEQAIFITLDRITLDIEQNKAGFLVQQAELFSVGIVRVDDMFINSIEQVQAYTELVAEKRLKLKMNLWFRPKLIEQLSTMGAGGKVLLSLAEGVKFVLDGAFGVRTAALCRPYEDDPENRGIFLLSHWRLANGIYEALEKGMKKVAIHCIGDNASFIALHVYEQFCQRGVDTDGWRLEHAELIDLDQARLAKKLGVVLSMQPNFVSDCRDYGKRLGDRIYRINPFRMLVDDIGFTPGQDLLLGSDGMPTGLLHGIQTAVNGFSPSQSMTLNEAMAGYTVEPETPDTQETNFVELSGDPLDPETTILQTVVDGKEVYKAS